MVQVKRKRALYMLAGLLVALTIVGTLISRAFASAPAVKMTKVTRETLSVTVTVSGKTEADARADVFAPVPGTLKQVLVTEGQQVKAGTKLAVLDTETLDTQVKQARSAYKGAVAQIDGIDSQAPSDEDISTADAQVASARRTYEQASDAVDRLVSAKKKAAPAAKAAIEANLSAAKMQKEQAYGGYLAAKSQARRLKSSGNVGAQRAAARANRDQAESALTLAENNRDKAELVAPIDGVVLFNAIGAPASPTDGGQKATAGCAVSPQAAPFTIVRLDALRFNGQADEADLGRIRAGAKATVTLDAYPGEEFATTVKVIRPTAVQTSTGAQAFPVLLSLAKTGKTLGIGMSGNAVIQVDAIKDAVTVPAEAIVDDGGKQFVYVVVNGKLARRAVETGAMTDTVTQIVKGLAAGDVIALQEGSVKLTDGMSVKIGG